MSSLQREEELLSVQAIYCDAFNTFGTVDETHFRFRSVPVVLSITLPLSYPDPSQLPEISIDSDGLGVSQLQMFQLRMRLEAIIQNRPDEPVLFELTEETREFTEGLREDVRVCMEEEEEEQWEQYNVEEDSERRVTDQAILRGHMGSTTIDTVVSQLHSTRLLHAEVVLRTDLRQRFLDMRRKVQHAAARGMKDRRARDAAWDKYGKEEIVFHGTLRQNVGSIGLERSYRSCYKRCLLIVPKAVVQPLNVSFLLLHEEKNRLLPFRINDAHIDVGKPVLSADHQRYSHVSKSAVADSSSAIGEVASST